MFRLTAILLVGLYAVMSIWGGTPAATDVAVSRADTFKPSLASFSAPDASHTPQPDAAETRELASLSAREAVQAALAAGERSQEAPTPAVAAATEPEPAAEEAQEVWYVTGSAVNLRQGPTTKSAILGRAALGDTAEVLSDPSDPWIRIRTEEGIEAWIYGGFLSETPA